MSVMSSVPHTKAARHALVTSLLTRGLVHSQQQLAELLAAEVIDGPQSVVWDEAENRLHVQKALIEYLLLGRIEDK